MIGKDTYKKKMTVDSTTSKHIALTLPSTQLKSPELEDGVAKQESAQEVAVSMGLNSSNSSTFPEFGASLKSEFLHAKTYRNMNNGIFFLFLFPCLYSSS